MRQRIVLVSLAALLAPALGLADDEVRSVPPEDPAHAELRTLRDGVIDAFNKKDLDKMLTFVHPNVVVVWQNGEVSRGRQGVRDYYKKMMEGPDRVVDSVRAQAEPKELTILYDGRHGLCYGDLDEDFKLANGTEFHLPNRWTATLVKEDGRWLIAGLHVSANVFDNPIQQMIIKRVTWWTGAVALVFGVALGVLLTVLLRRRRPAQP
jgi:uncharacterized protein (TIGR02246 family)